MLTMCLVPITVESLSFIHCRNKESDASKIWRCTQQCRINNKLVPPVELTSHLLVLVMLVGFRTRNFLIESHHYNPGYLNIALALNNAVARKCFTVLASVGTQSYIHLVLRIHVGVPGAHSPKQGKRQHLCSWEHKGPACASSLLTICRMIAGRLFHVGAFWMLATSMAFIRRPNIGVMRCVFRVSKAQQCRFMSTVVASVSLTITKPYTYS